MSSHSVATAFEKARADGRAALVGYLPAGFPDVAGGIEALQAMVAAGCDVIEVGLPYSDPVMDGPTVQAAAQQALEAGFRTTDVLRTVEAVAATGTPTLVMTYWNPVERYGVERFAADLAGAGGAGLITPDLTPDFAPEWIAAADAHDLDKVFLVAPSSTDDRLAMTVAECRRFVYATAVMGVTGARASSSNLVDVLWPQREQRDLARLGQGLATPHREQRNLRDAAAGVAGARAWALLSWALRARARRVRAGPAPNPAHRVADGGGLAVAGEDLGDVALLEGLDVHVGLVGLDDDDGLALADLLALALEPGDDLALGHGGGERGHVDLLDLGTDRDVARGGGAGDAGGRESAAVARERGLLLRKNLGGSRGVGHGGHLGRRR